MSSISLLTVTISAAVASLLLCLLLTPLARRYGLIDHPSERKVHGAPIPLVGGIAVYVVFVLATVFATPLGSDAMPLLLASGLMMLTGVADDLHELSPHSRFVAQILACCIMIFAGGVVLTDFGSLMWDGVLPLGWLSIPITIFSALGVINAFNMVDGMDGLSATTFIIAAGCMAWLALGTGHYTNVTLLVILAGAVFGFLLLNARLPWNPRAHAFLGDSGTMFLGLFLAWQFIDLGNGDDRSFAPITAVWLLGIPLLDTTRLMVQRWRRGESSMQADHYHLHHAFLKAGFSVAQTLVGIMSLVVFTTTVGLLGHVLGWPEYLMFYGYLAFGLVYWWVMHHCWHHGRFLGRDVDAVLL